jgi:sigma-B regulation protein RsbU (phosphoserine phosphatase)
VSPTELIGTAIGWILLALGFASVAVWSQRRRRAERLLLLFGIWCALYGTRLLAAQPVVRGSMGGHVRAWSYAVAFITYGINVPTGLIFEALIGAGWKQSVRRVWQVQAVYAAAAIASGLSLGRPNAAMAVNNPLVVAGLVVLAVNVVLFRERLGRLFTTPMFIVGANLLLLFVMNENLGRPVAPAINLEPVGVLIFVVALAHSVIGTVVRGEAELLAVQRELETARRIQRSLLPRGTPSIRDLHVAVEYLPMTAVAGDLYDFARIGPSTIGILVADVSGHGVPAALVASMVKLAFSAQAERAGDPAGVLSSMNRLLSGQLEQAFVTAIYAVIDTERRTVTVANAGHPALLIGRTDRTIDEIGVHGLLLGFMPDTPYANTTIELRDGDVILMYTDGVIEAQNSAGEFFDSERVKGWLASAGSMDATGIITAALGDLRGWCGRSTFDDDVTFLVARFGDVAALKPFASLSAGPVNA